MNKSIKYIGLGLLILTAYLIIVELNVFNLNLDALIFIRLMVFTSIIMGAFYILNPQKLFVVPLSVSVFSALFVILAIVVGGDPFIIAVWVMIFVGWFIYTIILKILLTRLYNHKRIQRLINKEDEINSR